jgi:hypothetical protein
MSALRQLAAIEAIAVATLLAVAAVLAGYEGLHAWAGRSMLAPVATASLVFAYTAIFGAPFVILFGAPAYWLLLRNDKATWPLALVAGIAPGACLLLVEVPVGGIAITCGAAVALLTHWRCSTLVSLHRGSHGPA